MGSSSESSEDFDFCDESDANASTMLQVPLPATTEPAVALVPPLPSPSQITMPRPPMPPNSSIVAKRPPIASPPTTMRFPLTIQSPPLMPPLPHTKSKPPLMASMPISGAFVISASPEPIRNAPTGSRTQSANRESSSCEDESEEEPQRLKGSKPYSKKGAAKVRYTDAMYIVLLGAVNTLGAHVPKYGEKEKKFDEVSYACRSHPAFAGCAKLTGKSVRDRFMKLRNEFKKNDAENARTSGIDESFTQKDRLLYDMWEQIEEDRNTKEHEATKKTQQNQELLDAGAEMRTLAKERVRKRRRNDDENDTVADRAHIHLNLGLGLRR